MHRLENRRWLLKKRPRHLLESDDLDFSGEVVAVDPEPGQFLVRVTHLSFEPAQLGWLKRDSYIPKVAIGDVVRSAAAGEVVASRNPAFPVGSLVQGAFGWQDYCLTDGAGFWPTTLIRHGSPEQSLSLFGTTGFTAYFGMTEVGRPEAGQTVVVSAAAGATGSIAGQIAKALGCRVIGIAGGAEKCQWVKERAGFDECVDYRAGSIGDRLREFAPGGIDVFFDNVGGEILDTVLTQLARGARVVVCGAMATYLPNASGEAAGLKNHIQLAVTRSRMEGFIVLDYAARYSEASDALATWLEEGKLVSATDVQHGLENAPATLSRVYLGQNIGKQLLAL